MGLSLLRLQVCSGSPTSDTWTATPQPAAVAASTTTTATTATATTGRAGADGGGERRARGAQRGERRLGAIIPAAQVVVPRGCLPEGSTPPRGLKDALDRHAVLDLPQGGEREREGQSHGTQREVEANSRHGGVVVVGPRRRSERGTRRGSPSTPP